MYGTFVELKDTKRQGVVKVVDGDFWEVRLFSGSYVIAHKDFYNVIYKEMINE